MRDNLFVPNKMAYVKGKAKPDVECILCAIVEGDERVERLDIHRAELFTISLNLYPYSPGHLMIFPNRHIVDVREFTTDEVVQLHRLQCRSLEVLDRVYQPYGYNLGFNVGQASGASIPHVHAHVVPRYPRELGFIDVINGDRIIIEDPNVTQDKLRQAFNSDD